MVLEYKVESENMNSSPEEEHQSRILAKVCRSSTARRSTTYYDLALQYTGSAIIL